jgi:hypothetical protein
MKRTLLLRNMLLAMLALVPAADRAQAKEDIEIPAESIPLEESSSVPTIPVSLFDRSASPWWGSADYLMWFFKAAPVSTPLVTSIPPGMLGAPMLGQLGERVVLGGSDMGLGLHSGGRFTLGRWLDDDQLLGFEGGFLFLANHSVSRSVGTDGQPGSPVLTIPYFDPTFSSEVSTPLSIPGVFAGSATLTSTSRLLGWELNGVANLATTNRFNLALLGGFRYLNLTEDLSFDTSSPFISAPFDVFRTTDEFHTRNDFYGGQFGLRGQLIRGIWSLGGATKLAMGNMHQTVGVNGALFTNDFNGFGAVQGFPGGYFAQPSNIGQQTVNRFAVIPEVNLNFGVQLTRHMRARFGYSFLYVSSVARPGQQIDHVINPTQSPALTGNPGAALVGAARPGLPVASTDFWAQGLNFGLDFTY